jgi:uncharacterized protein YwqG
LLGSPQQVQNDMREECELVTAGIDVGGEYNDPRAEALEARAPGHWRLLLQLDSDDALDWMWGDAGRLYYWIRAEDLKAHKFDDTWLVLQCG